MCHSSRTRQAAASKLPALAALATWAPGSVVEGLQLISSPASRHPAVVAYAVRCLENTAPEKVSCGGWLGRVLGGFELRG